MAGWQFWIDRGGTFTDVVARRPDGSTEVAKLLSENPRQYDDAAIAGIRRILDVAEGEPLPATSIDSVKMGTTVATNALLERAGEPTVFVTTAGFGDALRIGYQARPDLFDLDIVLPEMLYDRVLEVDERMGPRGAVEVELDIERARVQLQQAKDDGFDSIAIALMHGYRFDKHERALGAIAREVGFSQVSVSHEVSPLMKLVPRGDTTVVDAYLSPILRRYVDRVDAQLRPDGTGPLLMFMQSNGGLTDATHFHGKDALLSGPAGGVVGMVETGLAAGFDRQIGFDMGGTSTDVSHYAGDLERTHETVVAGVRVRAPMMSIHTVAAGGGSILHFDGARLRVGPDSAGADPGPACYGNDGPLAVTDCNVLLGKLRPEFFPAVFGANGAEPLDAGVVRDRFDSLASEISDATGVSQSPESTAEGFLSIAVENMANAIKKISVERGHDVTDYTLVCFGGAGGQHACLVADRLHIGRVLIHPLAGVLSAVGIGLAAIRHVADGAVEAPLGAELLESLTDRWEALESEGEAVVTDQGVAAEQVTFTRRVALRYEGSDTALTVEAGSVDQIVDAFEAVHMGRFGFVAPDKVLIVESMQLETVGASDAVDLAIGTAQADDAEAALLGTHDTFMAGEQRATPFLDRAALVPGKAIAGPAVIIEPSATTVVEPGWAATLTDAGDLVLERVEALPERAAVGTSVDPVQLEIFNNLFMNIAEQMGVGEHRRVGEHQGTPRLLVCDLRPRRRPCRECSAYAGAPGVDERVDQVDHPPEPQHAPRRRVCHERALQRRHPPA